MSDLERVGLMEEANWKPASTYWKEQCYKHITRINHLEYALREIIAQDDVGGMVYRKDGPCAVIARIALGERNE